MDTHSEANIHNLDSLYYNNTDPRIEELCAEDKKPNKSSYKRRKDQNSEISELEALLPWSQKGAGIDKISTLRLTSTFMKFRDFWTESLAENPKESKIIKKPFPGIEKLLSEAIDGFLLILSSSGEVLYVSEGVADYVGVTQQEIIGLSIYELTHTDDHQCIRDNLKAKGIKPRQFRQFYIRFKSSISPVKKQLSKFGGTIMLQVSGNLKISQRRNQYLVSGLVAECRRIESSSSILEVSVPQVMFTSTTTMDLKILSVDTKMSTVTGFKGDIKGTVLTDFFHPSDNRRSIHCLKLLLITGQADSPIIRFMTHTGEWVWVQIQGLLRYEKDNKSPKYLEANFKLICASGDSLTMIEQKELYGKVDTNSENAGIHADSRFAIPDKSTVEGPEDIIKGIEEANVSSAVRDVILHGREEALMSIPMNMDRLACWGEVVESVVEYETSNGLPPNYDPPYPAPPSLKSFPSTSSPLSSLSPATNPSPTSGSSLPLSHPVEMSPFSNPSSQSSGKHTPPNDLPSELANAFDIYMPSDSTTTTFNSMTNQIMGQQLPGAVVTQQSQTMFPTNPVTVGNSGLPGQYSGNPNFQSAQQFNQPGVVATQHNGVGVMASQYNSPGVVANQYNLPMNGGSNTMGMQFNGPNVIATQYNGPGTIASQYNDGGSIASQYNTGNVIASQHNGMNAVGSQYNGPSTNSTQFNGPAAYGSQYNNSTAHAQQFNQSHSTPSQYNVVANQYVGVQPTLHHQQVDGMSSIPFNAPLHNNGTNQLAPVINMNVTINVPPTAPPVIMGHNNLSSQKLSHQLGSYNPSTFPVHGKEGYMHVGKLESPLDGKPCMPYNVQGSFEVSGVPHNGGFGMMETGQDILEALELI